MGEESSKGIGSGKGKGALGVPPSMKGLNGAKGWMLQKGMKGVKGKFQKGAKGLMKGKADKGKGKSATPPSTQPAPPPENTSPSSKSPLEIPTTPSSKPSPSLPDSTVPTTPASDGATPGSVEKKGDGQGPFNALMAKGIGKGKESGDGKENEAGEEQAREETKDRFVHLRVVLCTCVFHILYSIVHGYRRTHRNKRTRGHGGDNTVRAHIAMIEFKSRIIYT